MERLTVRVREGNRKGECFIPGNKNSIEKVEYIHEDGRWESEEYKGKAVEKLAEYEDLEEQGKLLKLPCAVGDTVYCIFTSMKGTNPVIFSQKFNYGMVERFGKTVFLTKEEAEQSLER